MSLSAAVIDALVASGATVEQLAAAMKADVADREASEAARIEAKRSGNAERQARFRQRQRLGNNDSNALLDVTERDSVTPDPSLDKSPQTPKINPTPCVSAGDAPTREARPFACPEGVDPQHWSDFLANRKRRGMANTATAYRGQLRELANLSDDEWPPGRLVQHAAEKGWGGIHDPRNTANGSPQNGQRRANPPSGTPSNPLRAALERRRDREAGGRFPAGDRPAIANTG